MGPFGSNIKVSTFVSSGIPIIEKYQNNIHENQRLITIRDSLLPKLMSGELDVSEIEI